MYEEEKEESDELARENETTKKEPRRDKETHVWGVEDLGRHHGPREPLELAHPLRHDQVDGTGLPPPAERHQAGPEVVQQDAEDPGKERIKELRKTRGKKKAYVAEKSTPITKSTISAWKKKDERKKRKKMRILTRSRRPWSSGRQTPAPPPSP